METAIPGTKEKVLAGQMKIPHGNVEALGKEKTSHGSMSDFPSSKISARDETITRLSNLRQSRPKEYHPPEYYYPPQLDATTDDILKYGFSEMEDAFMDYCSRWNAIKNMYGHMFDDPAVTEGLEKLLQNALKYIHGFRTDKVPYKGCEENE